MRTNRPCIRNSCPNAARSSSQSFRRARTRREQRPPRPAPASRRWISRPESAGRSFAAAAEPDMCRPDTLIYAAGEDSLRRRLRHRSPRSAGGPSRRRDSSQSRVRPVRGWHAHLPSGTGPRSHVLVWVDRGGREEMLETPALPYAYPRLSPDGTRVALDVGGPPDRDIWMWDLRRADARAVYARSSGESHARVEPRWKRLAFGSDRFGVTNLFWQAADGTGEPERLLESDRIQMPFTFAPDGRLLFSARCRGAGPRRPRTLVGWQPSRRAHSVRYGERRKYGGLAGRPVDGVRLRTNRASPKFTCGLIRTRMQAAAGKSPPAAASRLWSRRRARAFLPRLRWRAVWPRRWTLTPEFAPGPIVKLFENANYFGSGILEQRSNLRPIPRRQPIPDDQAASERRRSSCAGCRSELVRGAQAARADRIATKLRHYPRETLFPRQRALRGSYFCSDSAVARCARSAGSCLVASSASCLFGFA